MRNSDAAQVTSPDQFMNNTIGTMGQSVAGRFLASGLNVNSLRTNDVLRKDEWIDYDTTVVNVARSRLIGIADLRDGGLVRPLGGLGAVLSQYEQAGDMSAADVDMAGVVEGEEDDVTFTLITVPIPIHHKSFRVNIRRLEASRRSGESIDVTQATIAARRVRDSLESGLFDGVTGISVNGNSIRGYTDHPDRNTLTGSDWGTIGNIYTDCRRMVDGLEADNYFGPYVLYVATTQFGEMRATYTDGAPETALERVLRGLPMISSIKPSDTMTAGEAVMIQMTADVVDLALGQDITTVEWSTQGGLVAHFKIMAAMAQRVKSDANGASGVMHMSSI